MNQKVFVNIMQQKIMWKLLVLLLTIISLQNTTEGMEPSYMIRTFNGCDSGMSHINILFIDNIALAKQEDNALRTISPSISLSFCP